jgi:hypothetical protein
LSVLHGVCSHKRHSERSRGIPLRTHR